jgi:tRNA(fMet)-specific endonuclease VapC
MNKRFCLDTNIWSYVLRQPPDALVARLSNCSGDSLCLSELTRAELLFGAVRSSRPKELREKIEALVAPYERLPFGGDAVEHYADIRHALEKAGTPISPNDLIIAATARAAGVTLVTANVSEFSRVPGLKWEDWTK